MLSEIRPLHLDDLTSARSVLRACYQFDDADVVAGEILFGAGLHGRPIPLGAFRGRRLVGVAATSGPWIRILTVVPHEQKRGIGSSLLGHAENNILLRGHDVARTCDEPGNYLSPGIDSRNRDTIEWLQHRGYTVHTTNTNLLVDIKTNPKVSRSILELETAHCKRLGYSIQRLHSTTNPRSFLARIRNHFSPAWSLELQRALRCSPPAVHIALDKDHDVAAFSAHNGNNQGLHWYGPGGTLPAHRGRGLGKTLLIASLLDIAAKGNVFATIPWVGPHSFYEKAVGIAKRHSYVVLTKPLSR